MIIIYYLAFIALIFLIYAAVYFLKKLTKRKSQRAHKSVNPIGIIDNKDRSLITVGQLFESNNSNDELCYEASNLISNFCVLLKSRIEKLNITAHEISKKVSVEPDYIKKQIYELVKRFYEFIENPPQATISGYPKNKNDGVVYKVVAVENNEDEKVKRNKERYLNLMQAQNALTVIEKPGLYDNKNYKAHVIITNEVDYPRLIGKVIEYDDETIIDLGNKVEVKK